MRRRIYGIIKGGLCTTVGRVQRVRRRILTCVIGPFIKGGLCTTIGGLIESVLFYEFLLA